MALSKEKKVEIVGQVSAAFATSKMTVLATYQGVSVKSMQQLRSDAKSNGTQIKVVKNRLVQKALENSDKFKDFDVSRLKGQILYAFNSEDEVAPAQVLAAFAKKEPGITFVGAITEDAMFIDEADVTSLASLPSKEQLRGQLVGTLAAPLGSFINVINGNLRGVLNVLNARSEQL